MTGRDFAHESEAALDGSMIPFLFPTKRNIIFDTLLYACYYLYTFIYNALFYLYGRGAGTTGNVVAGYLFVWILVFHFSKAFISR